jgi:hypothetical protein
MKKYFINNHLSSYFEYFLITLSILALSAFLNHGSLGGDEGKIVEMSNKLVNSSLSALNFLLFTKSDALLQNHLAWISITSLNIFILSNLLNLLSIEIPMVVWNWFIAYPPALSALLSAFIVFKILRVYGNDFKCSIISVLLLYLCTPISSFLTGGWSECYLLLLISLRVFISRNFKFGGVNPILLGFIDALLIVFKAYSLFFVIIVSPIFSKNLSVRNKLIYTSTFIFISIVILILKFNMPKEFETNNIFGPNFQIPDFTTYLSRISDGLISLNFGVLTMPPIIILLICFNKFKKDINFYLITIAFLVTVLFLSLYPFWHGALGVAGQRYISPFILFYTPYIAIAVKIILVRYPKFIYTVFLLIFLYLQTLNYRNTLVDVYAGSDLDSTSQHYFAHTNFPTNNPYFHPAIFATTIATSKYFFRESKILITNNNSYTVSLDPGSIMPVTGISRILLMQSGNWKPAQENASIILRQLPTLLIQVIFILLYLFPFILIMFAYIKKTNENS